MSCSGVHLVTDDRITGMIDLQVLPQGSVIQL